ncbi:MULTISPECIES: hypothetical protein [unclassified Streptomyces]|uniref:hypothetical protein n=1 Tax=unclassified Streptomyces TaxID=2593676 RepID=UPI000ACB3AE5|nr:MULTISPECIES: hypothetical protein [unclassified Streptomyces]
MSPATPSSGAPGAARITPADQVNEPPSADAAQPAPAEDAADTSCADYEPL